MKNIAIFPGSFSPFTLGHKSIVDKSIILFDKIIIAIGKNSNKNEYFSFKKRIEYIQSVYRDHPKIEVKKYEGLTIDFCKKENAKYIIRGLRNSQDFIFEKDLANMNYNIENSIETVFLMTPPYLSHISSSLVREIIKNNGDIQNFVPKEINQLFLIKKKRT